MIIFKDRKDDWIKNPRQVVISTTQTPGVIEKSLQEAIKVFSILTEIDDLPKMARKFGFRTKAKMPTHEMKMPASMLEDMEAEVLRKGFRKRKLEDMVNNARKRRKTVHCEICGLKRISLGQWEKHYESKGHYQSVFRI